MDKISIILFYPTEKNLKLIKTFSPPHGSAIARRAA
jgi:hypothetical protein